MGWTAARVVVMAFVAHSASESHREAKKGAKAQREAGKRQEAAQKAQEAESRRNQIRQERVRRAQILQRAQNLGVAGSAGAIGSVGSLGTQMGSAMGFQTGQGQASQAVGASMQSAADHQAKASQWNTYSQMGQSAFGAMGGWQGTFESFKGTGNTSPAKIDTNRMRK